MGFWPFGGKKRRSSKIEERDPGTHQDKMHQQRAGQARIDNVALADSKRRRNEEKPLPRTSIRNNPSPTSKSRAAHYPLGGRSRPGLPENAEKRLNAEMETSANPLIGPGRDDRIYRQIATSQSSLGPDAFTVTQLPTLRARRADNSTTVPRRKSSKRKAEDHAREREIRAMSSPMPGLSRPKTYSGGPLDREIKDIPGGLIDHPKRPTSEVSLPLPETFSVPEEDSSQHAFKVSTFDILSPRPTIKYDSNPRSTVSRGQTQSRASNRHVLVEEDFSPKKKIDDLANDLDSSALRELMERDKRRRDKKRDIDRAKLQRKLQRRAERQREDEERKAREASRLESNWQRPNQNQADKPEFAMETLVDSALPVEPEIEPPPIIATERVCTPNSWLQDTSREELALKSPFADSGEENPFSDNHDRNTSIPPTSLSKDTNLGGLMSPAVLSPPASPIQRSQERASIPQMSAIMQASTPGARESSDDTRRASDGSEAHLNSWTTFFRRGGRRKRSSLDRGRSTPSEFSNTSRESFSRQSPPPIPPRSFQRSSSGTPRRTQSRFREDLPELPISPPHSRLQSPEAAFAPHHHQLETEDANQTFSTKAVRTSLATSSSIPTLDHSRQDDHLSQHRSADVTSNEATPPPAVLAQSLASMDSEGSWLSGKPAMRTSVQNGRPLQQSPEIVPADNGDEAGETADVAEDEYFHRLTPAPAERRRSSSASVMRKASSVAIDLNPESPESESDELRPQERADETWHASVGRQPTLVRQTAVAKSREGLLRDFQSGEVGGSNSESEEEEEEQEQELPDVDTAAHEVTTSPLFRARSVDYVKGHARHISAGSAKLLDIRRSSVHSDKSAPGDKTSTSLRSSSRLRLEEEQGTAS